MATRTACVTIAAVIALAPAGCRRPTAPVAPATAPAAVTDYRTLTQTTIELMINEKTGVPVSLTPAGPNKYTGTRQAPGESQPIPVTVTVEKDRIVVESRGGGLTHTQVITPRGLEKDDLR